MKVSMKRTSWRNQDRHELTRTGEGFQTASNALTVTAPFFLWKRDAQQLKWRRTCEQLYGQSVITRNPYCRCWLVQKRYRQPEAPLGTPDCCWFSFYSYINVVIRLCISESQRCTFTRQEKKIGIEFQEFIFSKTKKYITCPINYTLCLVEHSPGR